MLYKIGDALAGVMTNPFLMEVGFSKTEIAAIVKTYGFFATTAGAFVAGIMVLKIGNFNSLWICGFLQMISNLGFLLQAQYGHDVAVLSIVITIENFTSGMGGTAFVAYISTICSFRYTATQYALLTSIAAFGRTIFSGPAGILAENFGWYWFFILSVVGAIPGLMALAAVYYRAFANNEE